MSFLLPSVCSTFKGISPSSFAERWGDPVYGRARLELDCHVASEINEQLNESYAKTGSKDKNKGIAGDAKGAVARRNQRREARRRQQVE